MRNNKKIQTLVDLAQERAVLQGNSAGYTFLPTGDVVDAEQFGYADLDSRARAIAAMMQRDLQPGDRALLVYPSNLDYIAAFFGCLYAGVVAVPVYPPRKNHNSDRIKKVITDAGASAILTTAKLMSAVRESLSSMLDDGGLYWIATDTVKDGADSWRDPGLSRNSVAFIQYTSGSTGNPKGVILTHDNLLHNQWMTASAFDSDSSSLGVGWLPLYHDMGLIGNILQPLYLGSSVVIMPPIAFLQRPVRWLRAISHYQAVISGGPNFAYDLCVARIPLEQRVDLDLSSWSLAFNGAEPVRAETLERFTSAFVNSGFRREVFYPCYGLAEASLFVTGGFKREAPVTMRFRKSGLMLNIAVEVPPEESDAQDLVSSGRSWMDQQLLIVDPDTCQVLPERSVGEIWIKSPSTTQGYWMDEKQTLERCQARVAVSDDGPYVRSGDLGFLYDSELFITGRIKDLIIVRGQNHYPHDIERTAEFACSLIRENSSAAFSIEMDGKAEKLVLIAEIERSSMRSFDLRDAALAIRHALSTNHELQIHTVVFIRHGSIRKTSSGKIQRRAMKGEFLSSSLDFVGAWSLDWSSIGFCPPDLSSNMVEGFFSPRKKDVVVSAVDMESI